MHRKDCGGERDSTAIGIPFYDTIGTGEYQQAEQHARHALELLANRIDYLQEIGTAQLTLGRALLAQDRLIEAEEILRAADNSFEQLSSASHRAAAWIAIGAAAVAVLALLAVVWVLMRIRRLREGQAVLLGDGKTDLVDFAVSLQGRIDDLHRAVDEIAAGLVRVDRRVDNSVTNVSIVRYDAYEDTGGHQSASLAVLDSARTGVVVTAIQGRDYARIYMKELDRGRASIALSPEEAEAVERAMSR